MTTEAAISSNIFGDLYIALGDKNLSNKNETQWTTRIWYNPFTLWIWISVLFFISRRYYFFCTFFKVNFMKYLLLIFFLLSTFLLFSEGLKKDPKTIPSNLISKNIPSFNLKGLNNNSFSDKDLRNSELKLVNFFASWCPPCKVEHKNLVTLSKK